MLQPVTEQGEGFDEGIVAERGPVIGGSALAHQGLGHQQVGVERAAGLVDHRAGVAPVHGGYPVGPGVRSPAHGR